MFREKVLVTLMVLGLMVVGFSGCSKEPLSPEDEMVSQALKGPVNSKDEIMPRSLVSACKSSDCVNELFTSRAGRYCSEKRLTEADCQKVKDQVLNEISAGQKKELEEIYKEIEVLNKKNAETKRQTKAMEEAIKK
jgi:hypothetical protein